MIYAQATPDNPPNKNPEVNLDHPSGVFAGSDIIFRPVSVLVSSSAGSLSWNDAAP